MDTIVDRLPVEVLRVRADLHGAGPKAAFDELESKIPSLRGRRFYGTVRMTSDGEEYHACVERVATDDPTRLGLETAVIPGGRYVRRKVFHWEEIVAAGKMPELADDLARRNDVDPSRPTIEFYRSQTELHVLLPVRGSGLEPSKPR
ncbi:MAG TPA: hypothetical protein VML53_01665 [Thermoplasmata archaeon]|nr:hypothetical protein [Thermoplasmata archaeon]